MPTEITCISQVPTWHSLVQSADKSSSPTLFPINPQLNDKISLWCGPILHLKVDVVVNSTNETMTESSGNAGALMRAGGSGLREECLAIERCSTGSAVITNAYDLIAKKVVHCVSPRYKIKYHTAAEHALHNCYRKALQLVMENGLKSIAFPVVNVERKGYPEKQAAHIAVRTLRRFLEHFVDRFERIVLVFDKERDFLIYQQIMPLYFPRTLVEQNRSASLLPNDVGDEWGDTFINERRIPITSIPSQSYSQPTCRLATQLLDASFAEMTQGPDELRKTDPQSKNWDSLGIFGFGSNERQNSLSQRYSAFVRQSGIECLGDIAKLNFLYHSGYDEFDRPIVVFLAKQFPTQRFETMDELYKERILLYIVKVMDTIAHRGYVLVCIHSGTSSAPDTAWLQTLYDLLPRTFYENMHKMVILRPNWWIRASVWASAAFLGTDFPFRVRHIYTSTQLFTEFSPHQLKLPADTI